MAARLRAALNFGNPVLVGRDAYGRPTGITVDLAAELASCLGMELEFVEFNRAFDVTGSATENAWDICFLAVDPARSQTIVYTEPYLQIDGCYLIGADAVASSAAEVVEGGLRIGVVKGSAYALFLARQRGAESLVTVPSFDDALAALGRGEVDGIAGIRQVLQRSAALCPGSRVLDPPFMQIEQAVGVPRSRRTLLPELQAHLTGLVEDGRLARILQRYDLSGAGAAKSRSPM